MVAESQKLAAGGSPMPKIILPHLPPIENLASLTGLTVNTVWMLLGLFAALGVGTIIRRALLGRGPPGKAADRLSSLRTWWALAGVLTAALLYGELGAVLLCGGASLLAIREFRRLSAGRVRDRRLAVAGVLAIATHYFCVYQHWHTAALTVIPVGLLIMLAVILIVRETTAGFVAEVSTLYWGVMLTTFCFSHAVFLMVWPPIKNPAGGAAGWFLFVVLLTECNDIAQALVGRSLGRRKITPRISPNKTREGFLGGLVVTTLLAVLLAPLLTPLADAPPTRLAAWLPVLAGDAESLLWPALAGALIAVGGFFGDLTMSAIKRDAGVKDSSDALPGQGGVLDRIDSLTFSGPLFFYYVKLLYE